MEKNILKNKNVYIYIYVYIMCVYVTEALNRN